jgi:hypothetical protein
LFEDLSQAHRTVEPAMREQLLREAESMRETDVLALATMCIERLALDA